MPNELFQFWRQLDQNTFPRIHPEDLKVFEKNDGWLTSFSTWEDFIKNPEWNTPKSELKLQTSLVPVPYWGDFKKASIILLMLNPGFLPVNVWAENALSGWSERLWKNLYRNDESQEALMNFLNPEIAWHPGFIYWSRRFQNTLAQIQSTQQCSYYEALNWLGERVACLQLVAYASPAYALPNKVALALNSVKHAHSYVHDVLLPQVTNGQKLLIVARQKKIWDLPNHSNILELQGGNVRQAWFESDEVRGVIWKQLGM